MNFAYFQSGLLLLDNPVLVETSLNRASGYSVCVSMQSPKPLAAGDLRHFRGTFVRRAHAAIRQPDHVLKFRLSSVDIHRYYRTEVEEEPWRDLLRDVNVQLVGHRSIRNRGFRQTAVRKRGQGRRSICWIIIAYAS